MPQTHKYLLGHSPAELERLKTQADAVGEHAQWLFDRLAIPRGGRAIDVGCGPLGVLEELSKRVGAEGSVTGLDSNAVMVETARAFAESAGQRNVEIVLADASESKLPRDSFDVVHARLLLINLPPPLWPKVAAEMFAIARPGGVVALQDIDAAGWACDPPIPAWDKIWKPFLAVAGGAGEGWVGRRLPRILRDAGLVDIQTGAHAFFCPKGHAWRYTVLALSDVTRPRAIQMGLTTADELDAAKRELKAHLDDPNTTVLAPILAQAWGRKPKGGRTFGVA